MRLFLAVDIDDGTRQQLTHAQAAIASAVGTARVLPRVTWVNADRAHVTVRFIGEQPEGSLDPIQRVLDDVSVEPFDVTWTTVGQFGGWRNPRVLWLAPAGHVEAFSDLARRVNKALDPLVGAGESRPFRPHVTLGRVRDSGRGADWRGALDAVGWTPTVTTVERVTLYASQLSPKGPTYTALSTHG